MDPIPSVTRREPCRMRPRLLAKSATSPSLPPPANPVRLSLSPPPTCRAARSGFPEFMSRTSEDATLFQYHSSCSQTIALIGVHKLHTGAPGPGTPPSVPDSGT